MSAQKNLLHDAVMTDDTASAPQPIIDRSAARASIRARLDARAREAGHADHTAAMDADYAAWQARSIASPTVS